MAGVGYQSQAVRCQTSEKFQQHNAGSDREGDGESLSIIRAVMMVRAVVMAVPAMMAMMMAMVMKRLRAGMSEPAEAIVIVRMYVFAGTVMIVRMRVLVGMVMIVRMFVFAGMIVVV
jgi:hypothetical protein